MAYELLHQSKIYSNKSYLMKQFFLIWCILKISIICSIAAIYILIDISLAILIQFISKFEIITQLYDYDLYLWFTSITFVSIFHFVHVYTRISIFLSINQAIIDQINNYYLWPCTYGLLMGSHFAIQAASIVYIKKWWSLTVHRYIIKDYYNIFTLLCVYKMHIILAFADFTQYIISLSKTSKESKNPSRIMQPVILPGP